ncbi:S-DNA-T family DNA segregation ATPase FtsK/SpoIIIE [Thalassobacillus pellis]|nr:S-DNA-T family DNA segregation ATPase FtsK/SpoIIIE [Thalassobacillus pellis]
MKKKLKEVFTNDPSEIPMEETEKSQENYDPYVRTKMTYRYPKQGEFRFPVIPDQQSAPEKQDEKNTSRYPQDSREYNEAERGNHSRNRYSREKQHSWERHLDSGNNRANRSSGVSAHQEKRKREYTHTTTKEGWNTPSYNKRDNHIKREAQKHTETADGYRQERSQRKTNWNKENKVTVEKAPFQPSEVPSPIYGYHPRNMKSRILEDLPAYLEKNDDNAHEKNLEMTESNEQKNSYEEAEIMTEGLETEQKGSEAFESEIYEAPVENETKDNKIDMIENGINEAAATVETEALDKVSDEVEETHAREETIVGKDEGETMIEITDEDSFEEEGNEEELSLDEKSSSVTEATEKADIANNSDKPKKVEESVEENIDREGKSEQKPSNTLETKKSHRKEQTQTEKNHQSTTEKQRVPFNVLMTPRDKRSQKRKAEETFVKQQDQSVQREQKEEQAVFQRPPFHLLNDPVERSHDDDEWVKNQMEALEMTLKHFHVRARVVDAMRGPSVTRFEVQPEPGVKVSKITNLADDIKLSMAARDIRIEAPIPGKQAVGIEIPNVQSDIVGLQEIFETPTFLEDPSPLSVALGLDIGGTPVVTNMQKMPHGLIAGATGSGKSVCINTILVSLLYKAHHDDVKFLLIDPKMVELAPYNDLPHLVSPVITDVKAATTALKWAVKEMDERYEKFVQEGVRDVERYNQKMFKQDRKGEKLPYLVIVIDELADLMMVSPQEVEDSICRLAQKARACGIHLLVATQRPSVDVITGLIKANIPTRIAFSVSSQVDSRTIIDSSGAEKLLGKGDMLFVESGSGQAVRIQGAFVSDDEIERVTSFVKKAAPPDYLFRQEELLTQVTSEEDEDELFKDAVAFIMEHNGASASLLQRRFKIGYNRAARLIDYMESHGIISEQKGSKPRDILMTPQQFEEIFHPTEISNYNN